MAKRGYQVTGVDLSPDRLRVAERRAQEQKLPITYMQKDMADLEFEEAFDAAYILFNTICLLTHNDDLIRFLNGVHRSLKAGGLFVIEVGNLWPYIAKGQLINITYTGDEERGDVRRLRDSEIVIGPYNNLMEHRMCKRFWRDGQEPGVLEETHHMRIFSLNELDLLCRLTGFEILDVFGTTDIDQKYTDPNRVENIETKFSSYVLVLRKI
jgi:SAM-dependent methyltransferase